MRAVEPRQFPTLLMYVLGFTGALSEHKAPLACSLKQIAVHSVGFVDEGDKSILDWVI